MEIWSWIIGGGGLVLFLTARHYAHVNSQQLKDLEELRQYGSISKMKEETESAMVRCVIYMIIGVFMMVAPLMIWLFN